MWEFPSNLEFFSGFGCELLFVFFAFMVCLICWASVFLRYYAPELQSQDSKSKGIISDTLKNIIVGSVAALIVIFSSYGTVANYVAAKKCQNIDIAKVKSLRISKLDNEKSSTNTVFEFNDEAAIREGLSNLQSAYRRYRQKERFFKGYRVQLIMEDHPLSEFYVDYFSETQTGKKINVVKPHCGTKPNESYFEGVGLYSSSSFGDWIRKYIEPQFKK